MRYIKEAVDIEKIIKDLQGNFDGSNENQMQGVQLLKGLATSDDPKANEFMKKLDKATTEISKEVLGNKEEDIKIQYSRRVKEETIVADMRGPRVTIPAPILKRGKRAVQEILKPTYFPHIPIGALMDALEDVGIYVVDEAGDTWSGFFTGAEGEASLDLAYEGQLAKSSMLRLTWYKMPSGKYEVIGYLT